ncbi:hypothetical protein [Arcobacter aquimarinus]|uniref:hypothetical protein n=1 Tax=Arcobacter aquimarinus TaxID=1315211 RepID=UPI003BAEB8E8
MPYYHITSSQGRADTFTIESTSKNKVLTFLNTISTAIVRNIKEIVYSKTYNINHTLDTFFVPVPTYHRVEVFAYSENYSKSFTLYNVKRTITTDELKNNLLKLYILNEQIIGFFSINFYDEVANNENIDFLYQVQYKKNSKTYTEEFYSDSYQKVKDFFENVINGELIEIRKYVHLDTAVIKDDGDYHKRVNLYVNNDDSFLSISLPKIKKDIKHNHLLELISDTIKIKSLPIKKEDIRLTYR